MASKITSVTCDYSPTSSESIPCCDPLIHDTVAPIKLEDIIPFYEDEVHVTDPIVKKRILENKTRLMQIRISQINKILPELYTLWRAPSPLHYYIALLKKEMNAEELKLTIEDKDLQAEVDEEAKMRNADSKRGITRSSKKNTQMQLRSKKEEERKRDVDDDDNDSSDGEFVCYASVDHETRKKTASVKRARKPQKCNIACPSEVDIDEWNSWSDVHKLSYLKQKENPNTYLYRNLPPGEKRKSGGWSQDEHRLFLKRLHEMRSKGINEGKWGIFSKKIPGRVGYQCANYYRKLLQSGTVHDEFYRKDPDGTLHFKDRQSYHKSAFKDENRDSENEEDSGPEKTVGFYEKMAALNPLKINREDFITGDVIRVPAISPDGSVLDYNTWMKIIRTTKQDPFTLRHINKRQIVIITNENYEEYKNKIKHI